MSKKYVTVEPTKNVKRYQPQNVSKCGLFVVCKLKPFESDKKEDEIV